MELLIFIILLAVFFGPLVSYGFFWYEATSGGYLVQLDRMSRGKTIWWLVRALATSLLGQMVVLVCYPLGYWSRLWQPAPDPGCPMPPVLLVHGLFHNTSAWVLYRRWLRKEGFANVYAWNYRSYGQTFSQVREQMIEWIGETAARFPDRELILVGHSLGGLLIRSYLQDPMRRQRIGAAITLGTPHQGTKLAVLGIPELARSLMYRGELVRRLEGREPADSPPRLALYSPVDNMVLPNEALQPLENGWRHEAIPPVSHIAMLYHLPTARRVVKFIRDNADTRRGEPRISKFEIRNKSEESKFQ